jgi:hypothetical protein
VAERPRRGTRRTEHGIEIPLGPVIGISIIALLTGFLLGLIV